MSLFVSWPVRTVACHRHELLTHWRRSLSSTQPRWMGTENTKAGLKAIDIEGPDPTPGVLPPLNRPLGVKEPPTTLVKSRTQKMKELLDREKVIAERRHLVKEASKGYYHDLNMTRRHGGKTWVAPKVLIREDKALYLPNIIGQSLNDDTRKNTTTMCPGRITVLAMLGTQISEVHAKSFVHLTNTRFSDNPLYQYIQINLQENLLKSFLVRLFTKSLRSAVPIELQPYYLVSNQNMEYVRDPLGMTNSKVGYVYLVDENLKIRWGGCADATPEEAQSLETCTGVLLTRLEKSPNRRPKGSIEQAGDETEGKASS